MLRREKAIPFESWQASRREILLSLCTSPTLLSASDFDLLTQTPKRNTGAKKKPFRVCPSGLLSSVGKVGGAGLLKANCCENTSPSSIDTLQSMSLAILIPQSDWISKSQASG